MFRFPCDFELLSFNCKRLGFFTNVLNNASWCAKYFDAIGNKDHRLVFVKCKKNVFEGFQVAITSILFMGAQGLISRSQQIATIIYDK